MKQYRWWFAMMIPMCLVCIMWMLPGNISTEVVFAAVIEPVVAFSNPAVLAERFDADPVSAVAILTKHITQGQADALEAELLPVAIDPDVQQQVLRQRLVESRNYMLRIGLSPTDEDVSDIKVRIDAIPAPVAVPVQDVLVQR